jgi:hypothetical protein
VILLELAPSENKMWAFQKGNHGIAHRKTGFSIPLLTKLSTQLIKRFAQDDRV